MNEPVIASFEDLIAPMTTSDFLDRYWEKEFIHLSRNQLGYFDELFSLRDVDRWISSVRTGVANSVAITAPEGSDRGREDYRPEDVSIEHVYDSFSKGHSVVLNHLGDCWPPLTDLVNALRKDLCADVGVNVYLTPKGSRTFPVHTDDHDVFILQVYGEKAWRLHEHRLLPINRSHLTFARELSFTPEFGKARLEGAVVAEPTLRPGDVLYIPRGMPHCAVAKDTTSMHITLGITPLYWMDFLKAAVEQAHVHSPELRRALPMELLEGDEEHRQAIRQQFETVVREFLENVSFDETLRAVRWNRVRAQGLAPDGHLADLDRLAELTVESEVERRDKVLMSVDFYEDKFSNIRFGPQHIRGPAGLRKAITFIRDNERFRVKELPGLDDKSRLVLVRRLIREGLLRFVNTEATLREATPRIA